MQKQLGVVASSCNPNIQKAVANASLVFND